MPGMALNRGGQQDVEIMVAPGLPGQPDRAGRIRRRYYVEIGACCTGEANNIGPLASAAVFGRCIAAIKNLPISVNLLTPSYPDIALAVHGHGGPPYVQSFAGDLQRRVPNFAVETSQ